ncbi:MAG: S8 family serine peptidase [Streptosporangiaceae bacterium]|nr:S8 family serine peptidase [Streptosporangiaceae bacterium]MBV9854540.1 S8 family serine peptidase [Streptosporangiaceae bacterium]
MRIKRFRHVYPIAAAALVVTAFVPAVSFAAAGASGPGPVRARITGAVIPGSGTAAAPAAALAGLPSKKDQIKRLTEALAYMQKNYKSLAAAGTPGVTDIYDYGIGSLWRKGIDGAGTTIAVIEGWNLTSIGQILAGFDKQFDLPAPPSLRTIYPAGPLPKVCPPGMVKLGSYGSCDAWGGELALDVITAHMIAPYAKIVISATPADQEVTDDAASNVAPPEMMKALEVISRQHLANVISISDGTGETTYSYGRAQILANSPGELTAAAAGIPVLVATGDCGVVQNLAVASAQCNNTSATPDTATWDDSPWTTAVGGSVPNFSLTAPKRLGPDPLWDVGGLFSEGAGFSSVFTRPEYQDGVARITGSPMRSVPDITMDAQDGTSEAAPMFAGVLSLATQANGGNVGPVNPALYRVLGPAGAKAGIADVISGNDSVIRNGKVTVPGFTAGLGFDVASGWGTVYAPRFVPSLVAATRAAAQEAAARERARDELTRLELRSIQLTRTSTGNFYLLAGGFLPTHPVRLSIDGTPVAKLTANTLGDVTYMIDPATLNLAAGRHAVTLGSMLITETAGFTTG